MESFGLSYCGFKELLKNFGILVSLKLLEFVNSLKLYRSTAYPEEAGSIFFRVDWKIYKMVFLSK